MEKRSERYWIRMEPQASTVDHDPCCLFMVRDGNVCIANGAERTMDYAFIEVERILRLYEKYPEHYSGQDLADYGYWDDEPRKRHFVTTLVVSSYEEKPTIAATIAEFLNTGGFESEYVTEIAAGTPKHVRSDP